MYSPKSSQYFPILLNTSQAAIYRTARVCGATQGAIYRTARVCGATQGAIYRTARVCGALSTKKRLPEWQPLIHSLQTDHLL